MDDVVNQFAQELAAAMGAAVARDPEVMACREKARAAGYEMQVALEAVIGFSSRSVPETPAKEDAPAARKAGAQAMKITADDRRFLRSLRIAAGEISQRVE